MRETGLSTGTSPNPMRGLAALGAMLTTVRGCMSIVFRTKHLVYYIPSDDVAESRRRVVGEHAPVGDARQVHAVRVEAVVVPHVVDERPDEGEVVEAGGEVARVGDVAVRARVVALHEVVWPGQDAGRAERAVRPRAVPALLAGGRVAVAVAVHHDEAAVWVLVGGVV